MMCFVACKSVLHTLGSVIDNTMNIEIMQSMFDCMWF